MKSYKFEPTQSFRQVRQMSHELNDPGHSHYIAKLIWETGPQAGSDPLTYLWDPYAERFGHQIDKEPIEHQIVDSLINDIPVEVRLVEPARPTK